jgi:NifU-like protein involved in Fe-S cluster formation
MTPDSICALTWNAAGSREQGAAFHVSAQIESGVIKEVRVETYGCPHCIAAGSWLSGRLSGAAAEQLATWNWRDIAAALDVPAEKRGRLLILEDAIRHLAEAWRKRG